MMRGLSGNITLFLVQMLGLTYIIMKYNESAFFSLSIDISYFENNMEVENSI